MTVVLMDQATCADIGAAKLVALLSAQAEASTEGQPLFGFTVLPAYDANMGQRTIYLGGWSAVEEEAGGERGVLVAEAVTQVCYIRVAIGPPRVSRTETDAVAKAALNAVRTLMHQHPTLDGQISWIDMPRRQGDYESHKESTVSLWSFTTRFGAFLGRSV